MARVTEMGVTFAVAFLLCDIGSYRGGFGECALEELVGSAHVPRADALRDCDTKICDQSVAVDLVAQFGRELRAVC